MTDVCVIASAVLVVKNYRIARIFRELKFSQISRIDHNPQKYKLIFNPGIPCICEWDHTVLAKSGQGLGADATAKILSVKIQKRPIRENF